MTDTYSCTILWNFIIWYIFQYTLLALNLTKKIVKIHYLKAIRKMVNYVFFWILNTMNDLKFKMTANGHSKVYTQNVWLLLHEYFWNSFSRNISSSVRSTQEYLIIYRPIQIGFENIHILIRIYFLSLIYLHYHLAIAYV